ncbi:MAG: AMP-binding protein [SAR324 cluster bacterium]|nr:AMP-binding protein [SAR324 cluster bacterium]
MEPKNFKTIVAIAQQRAIDHPDRNYVIFLEDGDDKEVFLTYAQLDRMAKNTGAWLQMQGLKKGDRVITVLPNGTNFTQIFYGCLYSGILPVPLSEPAGRRHMEIYLETFIPTLKVCKPKVLITTAPMAEFLRTQLPPALQQMFSSVLIVSDEEILKSSQLSFTQPEINADDTAYLQFSSGSTGTPKGIMIGHSNIVANMEQARVFGQWEEGRGTGLWLPLFHDFGLAAGMLGAMYIGGFVVLMTPLEFIRKPLRWLASMSKYRCGYSYAPPFGYDLCLSKITPEDKKKLDLSCLVSMVNGAEPVHYQSVKRFNEYFADCGLKPTVVRPGFGMAETVIMFSESQGLEALCVDKILLETEGRLKLVEESTPSHEKKYLVSLGTHMINHEIAIRDLDNKPLPEGEVGEIMISGPSVCQGYYLNPEATKEIFQQELKGKQGLFLATGDMGLLWKNNLYFAGRIKDIIIIRGRNYYPQDIEYIVPQVKEVRPGCVVAFASGEDEEHSEHLAIAMEIKAELLKDMEMFNNYVLPAIDKKVVELVGDRLQIHPAERIYLEPGAIEKTSSGKIKNQANRKKFLKETFPGLIVRLVDDAIKPVQQETGSLTDTIYQLFEKIVEVKPLAGVPVFDIGGDSVAVVEFLEAVQSEYPKFNVDEVNEATTLDDIIRWIEAN